MSYIFIIQFYLLFISAIHENEKITAPDLAASKMEYRRQLEQLRQEFGGTYSLPSKTFFLFGMGNRDKYIFRDGKLLYALTGEVKREWPGSTYEIIPNEYAILLNPPTGEKIRVWENSEGIWIDEKGKSSLVGEAEEKLSLPEFDGHPYSEILKVLHHELLINIIDSKPLPNYFVYQKPWRRDAAMMAMCLEKTSNLNLIRKWVLSLDDPYDHNNGQHTGHPENEADNLGQTLYLLSLFTGKDHPLVEKILDEMRSCRVTDDSGNYIKGRSDFQEVPVYQTKWLIFGLNRLGIIHDYNVPLIADNYSSLFWWEFRDKHMEGDGWVAEDYPYIGWARDHFYGLKNGLISDGDYPLTWEKNASQANYAGMQIIDHSFSEDKIAAPHTWHAAEIFLYLIDLYTF